MACSPGLPNDEGPSWVSEYGVSINAVQIEHACAVQRLTYGLLTRAHCSMGAGSGASYSFWYTSRKAASLYLALQIQTGVACLH